MRNLAKYLVETLEANGVDVVFGIPGVHTIELYRALDGAQIDHVTPRHEQGAGFMADGYARVTGKPGVCFIITGPGMTNIATAMGQAYGDSIPMLVISTVNSVGEIGSGRGHLHEIKNQSAMAETVSAFSHTILDASEVEPVLARAFALFSSARPRPVHIQIPVGLLTQDAADQPPARRFNAPFPPAPSRAALDQAVTALSDAKAPMIIAGGGAQKAANDIRTLARRIGAPVHMTVNGRGILPETDPLAVPVCGDFKGVTDLMRGSDVILALGTELGPTDFADTLPAKSDVPATLIRVDLDPEGLTRGLLPDLPILADVAETVTALLDALPDLAPERAPDLDAAATRAAAIRDGVRDTLPPVLSAGLTLMDIVAQACPDAIIVGDSCQPVYSGCIAFGGLAPGSWFCSATGYGTLGYALPAAIGAAIGQPDRPVFGLIGDGGLMFTIGELASAVEAGTKVRIILWNNQGYEEIKRFMVDAGVPPLGVDIAVPQFGPILAGFGWSHVQLSDPDSLRAHLAPPATGNEVIEIDEAGFMRALGL
ncbi:putative 2-ketoarginine decarboxylase AruI [Marinibacterium anthonyi]|nr:putative 2-ketoarginine decarboxylase AruI [Marinibacterium anthonyi]